MKNSVRMALALAFACNSGYAQAVNEQAIIAKPRIEQPQEAYIPRLDKGLLDQTWFASTPLPWVTDGKVADYMWTKPGLNIKGLTIEITWEKPVWLEAGEDELDRNVADQVRNEFPGIFQTAIEKRDGSTLTIVPKGGRLQLVGRSVECNACSGLFSMAMEVHTFDLKLIDASSGELLLAIHHRYTDGWGDKGSGVMRKGRKWADEFAKFIGSKLI